MSTLFSPGLCFFSLLLSTSSYALLSTLPASDSESVDWSPLKNGQKKPRSRAARLAHKEAQEVREKVLSQEQDAVFEPPAHQAPPFTSSALSYDTYYTVEVNVGGQTVHAVPDTGSFSLLVTSSRCQKCANWKVRDNSFLSSASSFVEEGLSVQDSELMQSPTAGCCPQRTFTHRNSVAYMRAEGEAEITFGSGAVRCLAATDDVSLGLTTVKKQKIWEITWMDSVQE